MRLKLTCNAAGDIRLLCAQDKKHIPIISPPKGGALVCCSKLRESRQRDKSGPRVGWGSISTRKRMPKAARTKTRCVGAIIDNGPLANCAFLTGTLPGSTIDALDGFASQSGWIVDSITGWLRDNIPGVLFFGVWEYQKRGALHLHMCVRTQHQGDTEWLIRNWRKRWIRLLFKVSERCGLDIFARSAGGSHRWTPHLIRTDAQIVRYSVSRYLSKYLSKGSLKKMRRCPAPPSSWSFASRELTRERDRSQLETEVTRLEVDTCSALWARLAGEVVGIVTRCFPYELPYDSRGKGLVALASPVQGSLLFKHLAGALRCLQGSSRDRPDGVVPPLSVVAAYFTGVWIRAPQAA